MSVDVEIYMNNIIKFFRENPTDLLNLVPKDKEEFFYIKIKEVAIENYKKALGLCAGEERSETYCLIGFTFLLSNDIYCSVDAFHSVC